MSGVIDRCDWPEALRRPDVEPHVRGVFVGGCVCRGVGSSFRAKAHAHLDGPHAGWICYRSTRWWHVDLLHLHEVAHLVSGEQHHNDRYRQVLVDLGGQVEPVWDGGVCVLRSYARSVPA